MSVVHAGDGRRADVVRQQAARMGRGRRVGRDGACRRAGVGAGRGGGGGGDRVSRYAAPDGRAGGGVDWCGGMRVGVWEPGMEACLRGEREEEEEKRKKGKKTKAAAVLQDDLVLLAKTCCQNRTLQRGALGIAVKVEDGNEEILYAAVAEILEQLQIGTLDMRQKLSAFHHLKRVNTAGAVTGKVSFQFKVRAVSGG